MIRDYIKLVETSSVITEAEMLDEGMIGDIFKKIGLAVAPAAGGLQVQFANGEKRVLPAEAAKYVAAFAQRRPSDYNSPDALWNAVKNHLSSTAAGGKEVMAAIGNALKDDWGGIG